MPTKPMKGEAADFSILRFPLYASYKYDGIRIKIEDGIPYTNSLKRMGNKWMDEVLQLVAPHNDEDGEVLIGFNHTADNICDLTRGATSNHSWRGDFSFVIFDLVDNPQDKFVDRHAALLDITNHLSLPYEEFSIHATVDGTYVEVKCLVVKQVLINNMEELEAFEEEALALGYEGVITRDPNGTYKHGKSTAKQQGMLKIKRFEDAEAEVIGFEPLMHNDNEAFTNELGRTARSSKKEGLVEMDTLGKLVVRDIVSGVEFKVNGSTDLMRKEVWGNQDKYMGQLITYKHFPKGAKDKPRHPIFKCFRDRSDMTNA